MDYTVGVKLFIGLLFIMLAGASLLCGSDNRDKEPGFWKSFSTVPDNENQESMDIFYFRQNNIDLSELDKSIIRAEVEGQWQSFKVVEAGGAFMKWNFSTRLQQLRDIKNMIETGSREMPTLSGPHNGMVASRGNKREDSAFSLNNAVKGMGWLPRSEKISEIMELFRETWNASMLEKIDVLISLYEQGEEIFDLTKQTSLELYSNKDFSTQTFLNKISDPGVSIVFLDMPESYKLRCITQMIHPDDPGLTEYERLTVDYINLIHDYFHGDMGRKSIGVIYHVIQVYDNSPRPGGRGKKIIPY